MSFTIKHLAVLAMAFTSSAFAQAGLLGQKSPDGKIRFEAVEEFQIAGGHRVRLMPVATQQLTPDEAKRLPRIELAQAGIIRQGPKGRLVRLDESGKPSDVILPDDFAPKAPIDAATAQGRLAITAFQSRKSKTGELIAPEVFFVFIPGADPDRLALTFVNRSAVFPTLDEQLAAMEGFVASFPDSPLKSDFHDQLRNRLSTSLAAFDNHGPYSDLVIARRFADLAQRVFPGDPVLGPLAATVAKRIAYIDSTRLTLHSLAASGEWDLLLSTYLPFEPYQWSFPDLMELRQTALEESARLHAHRATLLAERQEDAGALAEFNLAAGRDPDNAAIAKLRESARETAAATEAAAVKPHILPAGSQEDLRFKFGLHDAEEAIRAKDFTKAAAGLQAASAENKDAPEILLLQARLSAAQGRDSEALAFLDRYDRSVSEPASRAAGNAVRKDVLTAFEKQRAAYKQELAALQKQGDYSKIRTVAAQALLLDPEDDDFLYYAGATSAVFRDSAAKQQLDHYLARSNSLRGNVQDRDRALRILPLLDAAPAPKLEGTPNWLSGRPLPEGVYYCPISGAFQAPIDSIQAYKLKMSFQWDGSRLNGIASNFDDDKGAQSYHALGGPESNGNFYFGYAASNPQVQAAYTSKPDAPPDLASVRIARDPANPPHLVDSHGVPLIVLQDSPRINLAALSVLEGPVSTTVAGNSFFNPFIWDGLHYFSVTYDPQGRMAEAREWTTDNLVRFTWSGDRLTEIRAFHKDSSSPYYQRTISYSGTMLTGESYSEGSKGGQIKYVYSGKVLQQVKVEDGGVHDGKTWTARIH